jgi:hypothetical protein
MILTLGTITAGFVLFAICYALAEAHLRFEAGRRWADRLEKLKKERA